MKKIIKIARKVIAGAILATLLIATAIPVALTLMFMGKESRDKALKTIDSRVIDAVIYIDKL